MRKAKEKVKDLVLKMTLEHDVPYDYAKDCALIAVKNEYWSNRELLFNLRSSGIKFSQKVYLSRLQDLLDEEKLLIEEIEKL